MGSASGDSKPWPVAPGSVRYPATFRYEGRWLAFIVLAGLVLIGLGVLCVRSLATSDQPASAFNGVTLWALSLTLAAIGAFCIAEGLTSTLILDESSIEDHGVFLTRRLTRAQIKGKASFPKISFIKGYMIYPTAPRTWPIRIELVFKRTPAFDAWIEAIPDVEAPASAMTPGNVLAVIVGSSVAGLATGLIDAQFATLNTGSRTALQIIVFVVIQKAAFLLIAWIMRRWRGPGPNA